MANKPFDYRIINPLERPKAEDLNIAQGQSHYDARALANALFAGQAGFLGNSFKAVPTDPVSADDFVLSAGILFTDGSAESSIDGVPGLSDEYTYKATYLSGRTITATPKPTVVGKVRFDLVEVKALAGTDRLIDPEAVDILNPALQSFVTGTEKKKTLTSSLDEVEVERIAQGAPTPTSAIVYKTGTEVTFPPGGWPAVPLPTVDTGYNAVVYIARYYEQATIVAEHLNDARSVLSLTTSALGVVPVSNGGTGVSGIGAAGSIAYSNGTEMDYTRATLFSVPQTGHILVSDGASTPNWIAPAVASSLLISAGANANPTWLTPGTAGQVVVSNGTSWEAGTNSSLYTKNDIGEVVFTTLTYQSVAAFTTVVPSLRLGAVRIGIQPQVSEESALISASHDSIGDMGFVWLRFQIQKVGSGLVENFVFKYSVPGPVSGFGDTIVLPYPSLVYNVVDPGDYNVSVAVKSVAVNNIEVNFTKCTLFAAQG